MSPGLDWVGIRALHRLVETLWQSCHCCINLAVAWDIIVVEEEVLRLRGVVVKDGCAALDRFSVVYMLAFSLLCSFLCTDR